MFGHGKWQRCLCMVSAVLGTMAMMPGHAEAAYLGSASNPGRFIYMTYYLTQGQSYEIKTANLSAGDTVLHVAYPATGAEAFVWGDDDSGGGTASKLTMLAPITGSYRIVVRAYGSSGGNADLVINGQTILSQNPFGGVKLSSTSWPAGERIGVTGTERGYDNDFVVLLLSSTTQMVQHDDDSGPNAYPMAIASSTISGGQIVFGSYPGKNSFGRLHMQDQPHDCGLAWGNDWDCDGLTDAMDALAGTNGSSGDTDGDGIVDSYELLGNDGWSMSEGGSPLLRRMYVEVDYMAGKQPYGDLAADIADIFSAESNDDTTIVIGTQLAASDYITMYNNCGALPSCVNFDNVKAANFSGGGVVSRPYFHYLVFADQKLDANGQPTCSSGQAEIFGNDVVVSVHVGDGCPWNFTESEQRGTASHELGHNLNLTHNGNDVNPNYSTVHASVMNYRYQMSGVPSGGGHRYSHGVGGCESCYTSPKQACINARNAVPNACPSNPNCDCDVNEWGSLAFNYQSGPNGDGSESGVDMATVDALGKRFTKERREPLTEEEVAKVVRPVKPEVVRARAAEHIQKLEGRGLVRGKDFDVTSDGLRVLSLCND